MLKKLTIATSLISLTFLVSCTGNKKGDQQVLDEAPITTLDGNTVEDIQTDGAIVFNSAGSDSGEISGLTTVNYKYDTAILTEEAKEVLRNNAAWLGSNPGVTLLIEGHCDTRGSIEYNLALGERRALSAKNFMVSLGVDPSRLTVVSYGKEKLIDMSDSGLAQGRNRRANFVPIK